MAEKVAVRNEEQGLGFRDTLAVMLMNRAIKSGDFTRIGEKMIKSQSGPAIASGADFLAMKAVEGNRRAISVLKAVAVVNQQEVSDWGINILHIKPGAIARHFIAHSALRGAARGLIEKGETEIPKNLEFLLSNKSDDRIVYKFKPKACRGVATETVLQGAFEAALEKGWYGSLPKMAEIAEREGANSDALDSAASAITKHVEKVGLSGDSLKLAEAAHKILSAASCAQEGRKQRSILARADQAIGAARVEGSVPGP